MIIKQHFVRYVDQLLLLFFNLKGAHSNKIMFLGGLVQFAMQHLDLAAGSTYAIRANPF